MELNFCFLRALFLLTFVFYYFFFLLFYYFFSFAHCFTKVILNLLLWHHNFLLLFQLTYRFLPLSQAYNFNLRLWFMTMTKSIIKRWIIKTKIIYMISLCCGIIFITLNICAPYKVWGVILLNLCLLVLACVLITELKLTSVALFCWHWAIAHSVLADHVIDLLLQFRIWDEHVVLWMPVEHLFLIPATSASECSTVK